MMCFECVNSSSEAGGMPWVWCKKLKQFVDAKGKCKC